MGTVSFLATMVFVQTTFFSFPFLMAAEICRCPLLRCVLPALLLSTEKCTLALLLCSMSAAPLQNLSLGTSDQTVSSTGVTISSHTLLLLNCSATVPF